MQDENSLVKIILVVVAAVLSGFLVTAGLVKLLSATGLWLNYRDFGAGEVVAVWAAGLLLLYLLSVYVIAILLYQRYPNRTRTLDPSQRKRRALLRLIVPALLILLLAIVNHSTFPGGFASAEARQQWAYTEFADYRYAVSDIQNCQPIQARIGSIRAIAPTWGQNTTVRDPGSSGHYGEYTLEVVGDRGIGTANSSFHIMTSLYPVKFTHKGKTETLTCNNAGQFQTLINETRTQTWREHIQAIAKEGGSRDLMADSNRSFFYPKDYRLPPEYDDGFAYPIGGADGESYIIYLEGLMAPPLPQKYQGTQYTVAPEDIEQAIQLGLAIALSQSLSAETLDSFSQVGGDKFLSFDRKVCRLGACIESSTLTKKQMEKILKSGSAIPAYP